MQHLPCEQLFQSSPNAYMVLDREFRYLEVNRAYELLTGKTRDQLIGRGLFEVFPGTLNPDGSSQATQLRASIDRAFDAGERDMLALIPYQVESAGGPTGEVRYWSATHIPLRDDTGEVVAVMQHTTDVTATHLLREEVRQARAAAGLTFEQVSEGIFARAASVQQDNLRLAARQSFLTDLFDQAPGFMAVLRGPEHVFELANQAYERLVGRSDLVGRTVREVLPEVEGQGFLGLLDQVRETARPFVGRAVPVALRVDGRERTAYADFVYQPVLDADGAVESIFVQGADVTDHQTALDALRQSEEGFRAIADLLPQMIWASRPGGDTEYFSRGWYEFTGDTEHTPGGHAWVGRLHRDDRDHALAAWQECVATGVPYETEYRLRDRHGEYQWVLARALPVRDANGGIVRWLGTCTLIHEQKRVQQILERSQQALRAADRQKDQFLAMLAHELRNPLSPIATAAHLLKMAPERVDVVRQTAEVIERQAAHMRHLVEDLMDVSRVTRGLATLRIEEFALADIVAAAVEQTAPLVEGRSHRLEVRDRAPGLRLQADPVRVTQILTNLINNAAKFTPPGGRIGVEIDLDSAVGGASAPRPDSRSPDTRRARITISDTGIGMPADMLERVFELFTQADTAPDRAGSGLGIGLALARSLAQLHGGALTARSDGAGQGATFELRLPLAGPSQ